jgi:protein associated with RNAse G/E
MKIIVIKQNLGGEETWRYEGKIIKRGKDYVILEAFFDRKDMEFHGICLCEGDRFVETYYFDRWYNVFEIFNREDGKFKGWYCNISTPAVETDGRISYRDLALDLLVYPDGRQLILDEDEFKALELSPQDRDRALTALAELQENFSNEIGLVGDHPS